VPQIFWGLKRPKRGLIFNWGALELELIGRSLGIALMALGKVRPYGRAL